MNHKNDLTLPFGENGMVSLRVGAIIMKDGKVLMAGNSRDEWLYSVGGKIQFDETLEEAAIRVVFEETGYQLRMNWIAFIQEHFFRGSIGAN